MCGLAGILSLSGRPIVDAERRIHAMNDLLKHRGPDAQGIIVSEDGCMAMGNTRLAITDPNAPIAVPLRTEDNGAAISFNGEIYNYLYVRRDLEGNGVRFRNRTDTEVLLEGIRAHGEDFLDRLDGMWAFAYYDFRKRRLLLSRDLLGERHLFYRVIDDQLVFASEPLPILADRGRSEEIDINGVVTALRYYSPASGSTLVKGLKRLRPGHNLVATHEGECREYRHRRLHPEKWFDFFQSDPSLDAVINEFEEIMHGVSLRRLPPDVPYTATLSGGLDSALICAYASEFGQRTIPTLFGQCADVPGQNHPEELDEYEASLVTSRRLNTQHQRIHLNDADCIPVLQRLAETGFDGLLDPGVAAYEMLAWQVRRSGLKVMLISDGPDELVGGYTVDRRGWNIDRQRERNPLLYTLKKALSTPRIGRRALARLGYSNLIIPPDFAYDPFHFPPQHQANSPDSLGYFFSAEDIAATNQSYGSEDECYRDILPHLDATQRRALSYAAISLPDMFNLRTDKAFLRAAVECRVPFQAPELVEFLIALPAKDRFSDGSTTKLLFREIVGRRIGSEVASRSKHGFGAPLVDTPEVAESFEFEDVIQSSSMFQDLPFLPDARAWSSHPGFRKMRWPLFVLAKTHEQLRSGRYQGVPGPN